MELAGSYWQVLLAGLVAIYSLGSSSSVVQEHLTSIQKVLGSFPSWVPFFFFGGGGGGGGISLLPQKAFHLKEFAVYQCNVPTVTMHTYMCMYISF